MTERFRMCNEINLMNKRVGSADEIALDKSKRELRAFLLSVLPPHAMYYKNILDSVFQKKIDGLMMFNLTMIKILLIMMLK